MSKQLRPELSGRAARVGARARELVRWPIGCDVDAFDIDRPDALKPVYLPVGASPRDSEQCAPDAAETSP
jgi:hypothetical protein